LLGTSVCLPKRPAGRVRKLSQVHESRLKASACGIAADEGFGKDDEFGPLPNGVGGEVRKFLKRLGRVDKTGVAWTTAARTLPGRIAARSEALLSTVVLRGWMKFGPGATATKSLSD
jgi:hypothetical protein